VVITGEPTWVGRHFLAGQEVKVPSGDWQALRRRSLRVPRKGPVDWGVWDN
jgi:hypothetical protein